MHLHKALPLPGRAGKKRGGRSGGHCSCALAREGGRGFWKERGCFPASGVERKDLGGWRGPTGGAPRSPELVQGLRSILEFLQVLQVGWAIKRQRGWTRTSLGLSRRGEGGHGRDCGGGHIVWSECQVGELAATREMRSRACGGCQGLEGQAASGPRPHPSPLTPRPNPGERRRGGEG